MHSDSRILVVEAQFLVALEIQQVLTEAGAAEVELCQSVVEAAARLDQPISLALVEARLGAEDVMAFCRVLEERGIPVVMVTADPAAAAMFRDKPVLPKPFDREALLAVARRAFGAPQQAELRGEAWS